MATQENTKVTQRYGTGVALTLRCSCGSLVSTQHLSSNALAKGTADLEFVAKFGELWQPKKIQKSHSVTAQVLH